MGPRFDVRVLETLGGGRVKLDEYSLAAGPDREVIAKNIK